MHLWLFKKENPKKYSLIAERPMKIIPFEQIIEIKRIKNYIDGDEGKKLN